VQGGGGKKQEELEFRQGRLLCELGARRIKKTAEARGPITIKTQETEAHHQGKKGRESPSRGGEMFECGHSVHGKREEKGGVKESLKKPG